jgi:hypothetical protein
MVMEREQWSAGTKKIAQIGVYSARGSSDSMYGNSTDVIDEGVYRLLSELKYTFDFLDFTDDIGGYELVILPDRVRLNAGAAAKINGYVKNGGKLIVTCDSGVLDGVFQIEGIGVAYAGPAQYAPRYMRITTENFPEIQPMDYVEYERGAEVGALEGTRVLAPIVNPYFNRGYFRFCSHRHTPPELDAADFAAIALNRGGNIAYIAQPLFTEYANSRCMLNRDILREVLNRLEIAPLIKADMPSFVETTLRKTDGTVILHILNYIIERKCRRLDTIEESVPLFNRRVAVRLDKKPSRVKLAPFMEAVDFKWDGRYAEFVLKKVGGYEIVEIS